MFIPPNMVRFRSIAIKNVVESCWINIISWTKGYFYPRRATKRREYGFSQRANVLFVQPFHAGKSATHWRTWFPPFSWTLFLESWEAQPFYKTLMGYSLEMMTMESHHCAIGKSSIDMVDCPLHLQGWFLNLKITPKMSLGILCVAAGQRAGTLVAHLKNAKIGLFLGYSHFWVIFLVAWPVPIFWVCLNIDAPRPPAHHDFPHWTNHLLGV